MLTQFEQLIVRLRDIRTVLNDALLELSKEQKKLHDAISQRVFSDKSRFSKYKDNISIINRAKKDREFSEYQRLSEQSKQVDSSGNVIALRGKNLRKYKELSQRFASYYDATTNPDVVLVKSRCAEEIADVENSSEAVMQEVVAYKTLRSVLHIDLSALVAKAGFPDEKLGQTLSLLNLYASVDAAVLSGEGDLPRYVISMNLEALARMKHQGILGDARFMEILKAQFIHEVNGIYLQKERNIKPGPFSARMIAVYRCQRTDMTKVQTVDSVESAGKLIENATVNCQIIENLAAIKNKQFDMRIIAEAATSELTRILANNLGGSGAQVNEIYALPVDRNGAREMDRMALQEIQDSIGILQIDNARQFQYIPKREVLYSENESGIVDWFESEDVSFDSDMAEFELLA